MQIRDDSTDAISVGREQVERLPSRNYNLDIHIRNVQKSNLERRGARFDILDNQYRAIWRCGLQRLLYFARRRQFRFPIGVNKM
jgi:hypothetical protein